MNKEFTEKEKDVFREPNPDTCYDDEALAYRKAVLTAAVKAYER